MFYHYTCLEVLPSCYLKRIRLPSKYFFFSTMEWSLLRCTIYPYYIILKTRLSVCICVCQSVCLFISLCLSVCLSVYCMSIGVSACLPVSHDPVCSAGLIYLFSTKKQEHTMVTSGYPSGYCGILFNGYYTYDVPEGPSELFLEPI